MTFPVFVHLSSKPFGLWPKYCDKTLHSQTSARAACDLMARILLVGPEMLIAPNRRSSLLKIGAPMQLASGSVSPLSSAYPLAFVR